MQERFERTFPTEVQVYPTRRASSYTPFYTRRQPVLISHFSLPCRKCRRKFKKNILREKQHHQNIRKTDAEPRHFLPEIAAFPPGKSRTFSHCHKLLPFDFWAYRHAFKDDYVKCAPPCQPTWWSALVVKRSRMLSNMRRMAECDAATVIPPWRKEVP